MNIFKKFYFRTFQTMFKLALPILPYREPVILKTDDELLEVLENNKADSVLLVTDKGIYDLVGNMCEWTMEGYKKESRFIRGGAYDVYEPSIARPYAFVTQQVCPCLGFRIALYVE